MNPEISPEPAIQPHVEPLLQQVDSNQKPKWTLGKILIGSVVGFINFIALLVIGFVAEFFVSVAQHPNSADIVAIVFVQVGGIALFVVSIVDGICCLSYLLRKGKSKGKRVAAAIGLGLCAVVCLAVLSLAAVFLYFDFNSSAIR